MIKDTTMFKEKLEAEKASLQEELASIALFHEDTKQWEAVPDQDLMGEIDDNDAADRFEDFEERSSMVNTLGARFLDISDALAKIEAGTFGDCQVCGKEIQKDRLDANPAAKTCKEHINS